MLTVALSFLSAETAELGGDLMHTYVRRDDFAAVGAEPSDTEDVVNATLSVSGAKAAVIFVGQLRGGFKLSFRSRCHSSKIDFHAPHVLFGRDMFFSYAKIRKCRL